MSARTIRLSRFTRRGATAGVLVPIDHGLTLGPLGGIRNLAEIASWIGHPAIAGVIAHKGIVERLGDRGLIQGQGVMVHLNGMSSFAQDPDTKTAVTSVRAALRLGADAVSLQVNFDGQNDAHNLALLGRIVDEAHREGLPVLTMLYDKVQHEGDKTRILRQRHLIRLAVELGTDALKLAPPPAARLAFELPEIVADHALDTAIYFAGGATVSDQELLTLAREAVRAGAKGLCVGRNVFGRASPGKILAELDRVMNAAPLALAEEASNGGTALGVH